MARAHCACARSTCCDARTRSSASCSLTSPPGLRCRLGWRRLATLMERIHGRLPDGTLIEGVEVFRRLYAAVGFGFLVAASRLPLVAPLLNLSYRAFAKDRPAPHWALHGRRLPGTPRRFSARLRQRSRGRRRTNQPERAAEPSEQRRRAGPNLFVAGAF